MDGRLVAERALARSPASGAEGEAERSVVPEKGIATAGFESKQHLPITKDSDPDMDRHMLQFH